MTCSRFQLQKAHGSKNGFQFQRHKISQNFGCPWMPTDDTNRWATTRCRATGAGNRSRGTVRGSFNRPIVARTKSLRFARRDAGSRMRCQSASDGRSGGPRSAGSLRREADQRLEECPHRYTRRAAPALRRAWLASPWVEQLKSLHPQQRAGSVLGILPGWHLRLLNAPS